VASDPQVTAIRARLRAEINQAKKALVLAVDANLRAAPSEGGTPVDTGHARANNVPGVGTPTGVEAMDDAAHAAGVIAVMSSELEDDLYEANAVPYFARLNLGSSTQAPAGFVEAAVDRAVAEVQRHYDGLQVDVTRGEGPTVVQISGRPGGET
jgi:hypothetical protein